MSTAAASVMCSHATALRAESRPQPQDLATRSDERDALAALQQVFRQGMGMGLALTEASGNLSDCAQALDQQTGELRQAASATQDLARSSQMVGSKIEAISSQAGSVGRNVCDCISILGGSVQQTTELLGEMVRNATEIETTLSTVSDKVDNLRKSSASIQNVAREIQLLAVNAGVEAARHGAAGRGFAVIAEAVKKLADQTRQATEKTDQHLLQLAETMAHVIARGEGNLAAAQTSRSASASMVEGIGRLQASEADLRSMVRDVEGLSAPVRQNVELCANVLERVAASAKILDTTNTGIQNATEQFERLVGQSQTITSVVLGTSVPLPISELAEICQEGANAIAATFENALRSGQITREQLFDESYRPVQGTNPLQHMTAFVNFTDRELAGLQDGIVARDRRIVFCAAVDRNGYLPTHNRQFSLPQSDDPEWNQAHCRNRRIFEDRTSLASARNTRPLLLQTYRRDMGNGEFMVMNELSAPITVGGRHWGGLRMGFKHDK